MCLRNLNEVSVHLCCAVNDFFMSQFLLHSFLVGFVALSPTPKLKNAIKFIPFCYTNHTTCLILFLTLFSSTIGSLKMRVDMGLHNHTVFKIRCSRVETRRTCLVQHGITKLKGGMIVVQVFQGVKVPGEEKSYLS